MPLGHNPDKLTWLAATAQQEFVANVSHQINSRKKLLVFLEFFLRNGQTKTAKTTVLLALLLAHEPNSELSNISLSPTNLRLDKQKSWLVV